MGELEADGLAREWLADHQTERLHELVETKLEQRRDVVRAKLPEEESAAEVIDLMRVLKERLRAGGEAGERRAPKRAPRTEDLDDSSKEELYQRAKALDIPGRSKMGKEALIEAIRSASR